MRVAINGFGRIGKSFLRAYFAYRAEYKDIEIVAINAGSSDAHAIAYMYRYDTTMGTYPGVVSYTDTDITIDGVVIHVFSELSPQKLPWKELKIECVIEATGVFTQSQQAYSHIQAGAERVVITAPSSDEAVCTIVPGVTKLDFNDGRFFSVASCTTNAVMPLFKLIDDVFGIECASMTTTHAYTNSQELLDVNAQKKDMRRSRAAACNIIPATTGAHTMVKRLLPHLDTKVSLYSVRVPVPNVSLIDLTCQVAKTVDFIQVQDLFHAVKSHAILKNIIGLEYDELVSTDFYGKTYSVIIDMPLLSLENNGWLKIFGWYDNEWGYSCRLLDVVQYNACSK